MHQFTIGIEEEFQIIEPGTLDLCSYKHNMLEKVADELGDKAKAEMHSAVIELTTDICEDMHKAKEEIYLLRRKLIEVADKENLLIAAAGTHPFAKWKDQNITNHPRYLEIVEEMQDAARQNLIFGLHIHIGVESRDAGVYMMNPVRYFLPHIFALSTNSPFWDGDNTGFKSFRSKVFDKFPRTGIPEYFHSLSDYDDFVNLLVKTGCIDDGKKIWWDVRAHPYYKTIEFRICDVTLRPMETLAIAALCQALVAKLDRLRKKNLNFRLYSRSLINENKWRAARYGLSGKLIDFGREKEVAIRNLIYEFINFVDEVVDDLGSREYIDYIYQMLDDGSGADRQLQVFNETKDLKKVVEYCVKETRLGI